jgi:hypothetical protein
MLDVRPRDHCDSNGGGLASDEPIDSSNLLRGALPQRYKAFKPSGDVTAKCINLRRDACVGSIKQWPSSRHILTVDQSTPQTRDAYLMVRYCASV